MKKYNTITTKLSNRRVQVTVVKDSISIMFKRLIPKDDVVGYEEDGFKVRGRIAEKSVHISNEAFHTILRSYHLIKGRTE